MGDALTRASKFRDVVKLPLPDGRGSTELTRFRTRRLRSSVRELRTPYQILPKDATTFAPFRNANLDRPISTVFGRAAA